MSHPEDPGQPRHGQPSYPAARDYPRGREHSGSGDYPALRNRPETSYPRRERRSESSYPDLRGPASGREPDSARDYPPDYRREPSSARQTRLSSGAGLPPLPPGLDDDPPSLPPHLDPRTDDPRRGRTRSTPPKRTRGRTATIWALRGLAAALAVVTLAASGWAAYLNDLVESNITRSDAIPTEGNAGAAEVEGKTGAAMNILLVGRDSREGATEEQLIHDLGTDASAGGLNTDTMLLVHVPADGSGASVVSFPRDSYVDIPGYGKEKLNSAYGFGYNSAPEDAPDTEKQAMGQQQLVKTISALSGVSIDHYVEVTLLGFFNIANIVGGIEINLCEAVEDPYSSINLPAGPQVIAGADIVAFVRQRHGLTYGDIDRVKRQQYFIGAMARAIMKPEIMLNPVKQQEIITQISQNLIVDQGLNLLEVADQLQNLALGNLQFRTVPIVNQDAHTDAGESIVQIADQDDLYEFFASLSAQQDAAATSSAPPADEPAPTPIDPATVTVDVLNGSETVGLASQAAEGIGERGFLIGLTENADRDDYATTTISYGPGQQPQAAAVQVMFPTATLAEDPAMPPGSVRVVLGADFTAIAGPAAEPPPANFTAADTTNCIN